jgi:ATP adenylyltransferase
LKILWAPWRGVFLTEKKDICIFCEKPKENNDEKNFIFSRRKYVFGMLNKYPYNSGHVMISPYRHVTNIEDLTKEEWNDMIDLLNDCIKVIKKIMSPDGFNIGFNIGKVAGAGYEHIHLHIVPRWLGDTNFMPILSETKVISEHLEETYKKLVIYFK